MLLPFFLRRARENDRNLIKRGYRILRGIVSCSFLMMFGLLLSGAAYAQVADLSVSQTFSPGTGASGGQFTSTFTVTNVGPDTATSVVLTNTLPSIPSGGTYRFDTFPAGCTPSGTTLTCNLGNMDRNDIHTISVVYTLSGAPDVWRSAGTVSSATTDPNAGNNTVERFVTTVTSSDLELTATASPLTVTAGGTFQYLLEVENNGPHDVPADATITVQYTVPQYTQVTGASGNGWSCSPATGTTGDLITCTRAGPLAVGATAPALTVNAVTTGSASSNIDTVFAVGASFSGVAWPDPDVLNNEDIVSVMIEAGTDVRLIKTSSVSADQTQLTYTLTPRYVSGDSLTNIPITVRDEYDPAHFTFDAWVSDPATDGWNCSTPTLTVAVMVITCTRTGYSGASNTDMPALSFTATPGVGVVDATNAAEISLGGGRVDPVQDNNSSSVTNNVNGRADMRTTKSVSFSPLVIGQDFHYTVVARNGGPWGIPSGQAITVTDILPEDVTLTALPSGTNWTCAASNNGGAVVTYPVTSVAGNAVTVTCTYTNGLANGATTPGITIPAQITSATTTTNTACTALAPQGGNTGWRQDDIPANNCSITTGGNGVVIATADEADLHITKTASPNPVNAGQPLTYTLTVTNDGPNTATDVHLTDALTSLVAAGGVQSITITAGTGTCTPGTTPSNGGTQTVICIFPTLASGETASVEIVVLPIIDVTGNRTNTATVFSQEVGDPDHDNNSAEVTSMVNAVYDLTVETWGSSMGIIATSAPANSIIVFTTRVRNLGISRVPTARAAITLPGNATFVRLVGTGGASCAPTEASLVGTTGGTLICDWATGFNAAAFHDISYEVMAPSSVGSTVVSVAEVSLIDPAIYLPETSLTNNNADAEIQITPAQADIQIDISDSPDSIPLGGTTTYTITVRNGGPSLATDVTMTSDFNSGTGVFSYQGALTVDQGGSCVEPAVGVFNGQVVCSWPSLAIGGIATVTYLMSADSITNPGMLSGSNRTDVFASATEIDPYPANNNLTETTTASRAPTGGTGADLTITKTASRPHVVQGTSFEYTITVHNSGPDNITPAQGAQMIDLLPVDISLRSVPAGCSYMPVTRTLTCLISTLLNGDDYVVVVPVRVETAGNTSIVNTASVDMPGDLFRDNDTATATVTRSIEHIPALSLGGLISLLMLLALSAVVHRRRFS
jgi:uncharacterized repeat protein (TIGR01451 family)